MNRKLKNDWKVQETAEYKLLTKGLFSMSDLEVMTSLVGNDAIAKELFETFGSLTYLARATVADLTKIRGIGRKKAIRIVAAFEAGRRKERENRTPEKLTSSEDVANYVKPRYADLDQEVFSVLFFNRTYALIGDEILFKGGISATIIDPRIVFKKAINHLASAIILVHNHPSGGLVPSTSDIEITKKIVEAGKLLNITIADHIIVSHRGYFSFADEGLI